MNTNGFTPTRPGHRPAPPREVDVLVVGAGPAGAVAALGLAPLGARVLLVDEARFPRWKVCGCCLNGTALGALDDMGLGGLPARLGARRLECVRISSPTYTARLALPGGMALSRVRLDHALIAEAVAAGAEFRPLTTAAWVEESAAGVNVALRTPEAVGTLRARVVICADGLGASFTRQIPGVRLVTARRTRIGAGATLGHAPQLYAPHAIEMAVAAGGYVGLVRLEDDSLNLAAAFDVGFVRAMGGLPNAANRIIQKSGLPAIESLAAVRWRGTPPLTRRYEPPRCERLFLVGDAAEYVEPFTGEGMAWALLGGASVVNYVMQALEGRGAAARVAWLRHGQRTLGWRRRRCRWMARLLRHPRLVAPTLRLLTACPSLAGPYLRRLNPAGSAGD